MITDFSQCDEAMITKLSGLSIDGKEVPVIYITPEREFRPSVLPTIAIYRAGVYPDNRRWTNDKFYDNPSFRDDGSLQTLDEREAPIPYMIYYAIRIFYEYQEDGARLNSFINTVLKRGAYAEIGGECYDIVFISYRNPEITYKDFGEQKENEEREFVEQYLYKLEIELDVANRQTVGVSKELIIKTQQK